MPWRVQDGATPCVNSWPLSRHEKPFRPRRRTASGPSLPWARAHRSRTRGRLLRAGHWRPDRFNRGLHHGSSRDPPGPNGKARDQAAALLFLPPPAPHSGAGGGEFFRHAGSGRANRQIFQAAASRRSPLFSRPCPARRGPCAPPNTRSGAGAFAPAPLIRQPLLVPIRACRMLAHRYAPQPPAHPAYPRPKQGGAYRFMFRRYRAHRRAS